MENRSRRERARQVALLVCLAASVLTVAIAALMTRTPPPGAAPMAPGFRTPIIALELANTAADLDFVRGPEASALRAELQRVQTLDIVFPPAYAGMLVALFVGLGLRGRRLAWLGAALAIAIVPADFAENAVLNTILQRLSEDANADALLPRLVWTTWAKWGLIAICAAVLAALRGTEKRWLAATIGLATALAWLATAALGASGLPAEIGSGLVLLFFASVPVAAVLELRRGSSDAVSTGA